MDKTYRTLEENKIEKSIRNTKEFQKALIRATNGNFDEDLPSVTGMNLIKVTEKWNLREIFSLEKGSTYFKLYKEVFYIENPGKYYFETVDPVVYRRIAGQHETGDKEWAEKVSKEYGIDITFRVEAKKPDVKTKAAAKVAKLKH